MSRSKVAGILVIIVGVLIIFAIYTYGKFVTENTPVYFNPQKKTTAENLYNSIKSRDLDNDYPKTPEEVMGLNLEIIGMMYGNMIVDENIFTELIEIQRKLYGPDILEQNSPETQLETVLEAVKMLAEQKISHYNFEQLPTIYNAVDESFCFIRVEQTFNNSEKYYWEYQLEVSEDDGRWKIIRWDSTDENYNVMAE